MILKIDIKSLVLLMVLFSTDTFSTLWLNKHSLGFEANPIMAIFLDMSALFILAKILIGIIIILALWRMSMLSQQYYKYGLYFTCGIYGVVCLNNLVGVVLLWR